ncbi:tumor necrosis factor ligand superfamily member 6 [Ornithorhynchus anatinus]|uniref:Tumor necrosis factor ligand superfamily member 6 n=1 Tax=Ornithorhynchus anatinus TaxID=9258 RepID=F6RBI0_ORNAN|nr:tumor necrosis factor ligand superfamily member 6 [Ornithorhynchus anatinus]
MQQNLNYLYPQIYWVDSNAGSPCVPPAPCPPPTPPPVPERPGRRRPPPPPPPLPKTRRDHGTCLGLLMVFFMVLVALVGLGLGMFQIFHLQKDLADLRELTSNGQKTPSSQKQIGLQHPASEKETLRKVAHLTGKSNSKAATSILLEWEDTLGHAFVSGVKYKNHGLEINDTGLYFVYSKVYFRSRDCSNKALSHTVFKRNPNYPKDLVLMEGKKTNYCSLSQMWAHSSYLGAVFNLTRADRLYVNVSEPKLVYFQESETFFGLYKL